MFSALIGWCNWTAYASCLSNWTVRVKVRALTDQLHLNKFFFTYLANKIVVYSFSSMFSPLSFSNFVIKQIVLPLRGHPILLITPLITDRIG